MILSMKSCSNLFTQTFFKNILITIFNALNFRPYGVPNPRNFNDDVAHVAHLMNLVRDYISERRDVNNQSVGIRESERCMPEVAIVERIQNGKFLLSFKM